MALETFSPSIAPSPGTGFTPVIKLREADFGDGYSQSSPDGLNHIKMKVELSWRGLTAAQLSELRSFF
jgi:phage-related protein